MAAHIPIMPFGCQRGLARSSHQESVAKPDVAVPAALSGLRAPRSIGSRGSATTASPERPSALQDQPPPASLDNPAGKAGLDALASTFADALDPKAEIGCWILAPQRVGNAAWHVGLVDDFVEDALLASGASALLAGFRAFTIQGLIETCLGYWGQDATLAGR